MQMNTLKLTQSALGFAAMGVLPAQDVAIRYLGEIQRQGRDTLTKAQQVLESIAQGVLPSQADCRVAQTEVRQVMDAVEDGIGDSVNESPKI